MQEKQRSIKAAQTQFESDDAELIWKMAARLQAEAAERLESRSKEIATSKELAITDEPFSLNGFSLEEIEAIAVEAGISEEFVALALKELEAEAYRDKKVSDKKLAYSSKFLGNHERSREVNRVVNAPLEEVLEAMKRVFPANPYNLTLVDTIGSNDLKDAIMVFDVPQLNMMTGAADSGQAVSGFSYNMTHADLKQILVTLHAVSENKTEINVHIDLRHGKLRNMNMGMGLVGVFTLVSLLFSFIILDKGGGLFWASFLPILTFILSYFGYRYAYQWGLGKGMKAIEDLLQVVDVNARTKGQFGFPEPSKSDNA